jgi:hypothetical protein
MITGRKTIQYLAGDFYGLREAIIPVCFQRQS